MRAYSKRTLQSAAAALGNGNSLILSGSGACALQVTGTFSGTVTFEGHVNEDSATWVAIQGSNANTGAVASTATAAGLFYFSTVGLYAVRARVSTYASGTITVVGREVDMAIMPPSFQITGTLPAFAAIPSVAIDQTTPGTTNLVQIGSTLPAFAAIPAVSIDQTTPGTTNLVQVGGTLPAFAATPDVDNPASVTWGAVNGYDTGLLDGTTTDWYAVRNANDNDATDTLDTADNVLKYFDSDNASFDATAIWVKIPIMQATEGWRTFSATVSNSLGINLTIDAYAVPIKGLIWSTVNNITGGVNYFQIVSSQVVATAGNLTFGPGGVTYTNVCQWPIGWLVIKATPASDPGAANQWRLAVVRAK